MQRSSQRAGDKMQKQEILSVLYDLSLTIGGHINLKSLLQNTIQRILFHTSYSAGFITLNIPEDSDSDHFSKIYIDAAVGDVALIRAVDQEIKVPTNFLLQSTGNEAEQKKNLSRISGLDITFDSYLRLSFNKEYIIFLLAKTKPQVEFDLELVLQPVLSQFAKAILLCRNNDLQEAKAKEERFQLKKSLSQIENQYQSLISFSPIGICLSRDNNILQTNTSFVKLFGYETAQELVEKNIFDIIKTNDATKVKGIAEQIDQSNDEEANSYESYGIRKDGSQFPIMVNTSRVNTDKDPFLFTYVVDLTEQKRVEKRLTSTNEILRLIIETAPVRIFWKDNQFRYLGCNYAFARDAGKERPEDLIGKLDSELNWKEQATEYVSDDSYVQRTKIPKLNYEELQNSPDGQIKHLRTSKVPLFNADGEVMGVLGVYDDITGQKIIENELIALNQTLEQKVTERTKELQEANDNLLIEIKEKMEVTDRFEILVKSIPNSIILVDGAGFIQYVNPQTEAYFGYTEIELIGEKIEKIVPLENVKDHEMLREQYMKNPVSRSMKVFPMLYGRRKNGSAIPLEIGLNPIRLNDKTLIIASILDISERIKYEKEKKELAFRFELAMRAGGIGLGEYDVVNKTMLWDEQLFLLYGIKKQDHINPYETWRAGIHSEDIQRVDLEIQEAIREKKEFNSDFRVIWPDKSIHYIHALAKVIEDDFGNPTKLVGTNYDITKQKLTEIQLKESNEKLIQFIKNSPVYAYIKEVSENESKVIIASDNFHEMIGIPSSEMINKSMYELFPADFAKKITADDWEVVTGEKILTIQEDFNGKNYITIKFPLIIGSEKLLAGYAIDITDRIRSEENLKKARQEAEDANRMKSEFLANMSHEIRTPLNAIVGFSTILEEKAVGNKLFTEYLRNIIQSSNVLLGLINDILDLSKVEAGRMVVNSSSVNLNNLIHEILAIFSMKAKDKGITLSASISADTPENLVTDEKILRQIFFNLVGNAVKFTQEGSVEIRVSRIPKIQSSENLDLLITIQDSGIGIPQDELNKIFEPFQQVGRLNRNLYGGTGLGLSITRRLVELLGGVISVESTLDKGSTFIVHLKNIDYVNSTSDEAATMRSQNWLSQVVFKNSTILIAEDIQTNREIVKLFLEPHNINLMEASNGQECLTNAKTSIPDLILMDLQMPIMNGYDAAIEIKADPKLKNIPIVGLSASGLGMDKDKFEKIVDAFLLKPLHKQELVETLMKFLPYEVNSSKDQNVEFNIPPLGIMEENIEISEEMREHLNEKYLPIVLKLQDNLNIDNLIDFSVDLEGFIKSKHVDQLNKYCTSLKEAIDSFNTEKIYSTLVELSIFIKGNRN